MRDFNEERAKSVIALLVTTAATIANMYGFAVEAEAWVNAVLCLFNGACILYSWWFNQDVTREAFEGTTLTRKMKLEGRHAA